ncbi:MAG: hypothetical protein IPJ46_19610 [Anaerolineales bacterium]|nr:hypothetical protein [Anaerolineales bacterium]
MPTYDFICNHCEKRFEVFMTFSEYGKKPTPEFDDVVDRLEAGQSPDEIESALPDLGADSTGDE